MILTLAGLTVSSINTALSFAKLYKDWASWEEEDRVVDRDWLGVALKQKAIEGKPGDFAWIRFERFPTLELKGTHSAVVAINDKERVRYRIIRGRPGNYDILARKTAPQDQR